MCRMIGYLGGIVLFIVLYAKGVKGYEFFFATAIINLICIFLVIVFRIMAKYMNGFWKIWWKRMQKQVSAALSCLSQYTQMPEYEITTVTTDQYGNKTVSTSQTCNTFIWGIVQCLVCAALTLLSPIFAAFIIFCYIEAIIEECKWRKQQKQKEFIKQEMITRQSARMSLGLYQKEFASQNTSNSDTSRSNNVPINPYITPLNITASYMVPTYPNYPIMSNYPRNIVENVVYKQNNQTQQRQPDRSQANSTMSAQKYNIQNKPMNNDQL